MYEMCPMLSQLWFTRWNGEVGFVASLGRFADAVPRAAHFTFSGICVVVTILSWGYLYIEHKRFEEDGQILRPRLVWLAVTTMSFGVLALVHAIAIMDSSQAKNWYPSTGTFPEAILLIVLSLWTCWCLVRNRIVS